MLASANAAGQKIAYTHAEVVEQLDDEYRAFLSCHTPLCTPTHTTTNPLAFDVDAVFECDALSHQVYRLETVKQSLEAWFLAFGEVLRVAWKSTRAADPDPIQLLTLMSQAK